MGLEKFTHETWGLKKFTQSLRKVYACLCMKRGAGKVYAVYAGQKKFTQETQSLRKVYAEEGSVTVNAPPAQSSRQALAARASPRLRSKIRDTRRRRKLLLPLLLMLLPLLLMLLLLPATPADADAVPACAVAISACAIACVFAASACVFAASAPVFAASAPVFAVCA